MAFLKTRSSQGTTPQDANPIEPSDGTDALRRRARHRLIGATLLVLAAVLILPWLFDAPPAVVQPSTPVVIAGQNNADNSVQPTSPITTASPLPENLAPTDDDPPPAEPVPGNATATVAPAPAPTTPPTVSTAANRSNTPEGATAQGRVGRTQSQAPSPSPAQTQAAAPRRETAPAAVTTTQPRTQANRTTPPARQQVAKQRRPTNLDELIAQQQARPSQTPNAANNRAPNAAPTPPATSKPHAQTGSPQTPPVNYNFPEKGRFVVQIGAFVDADKLANVRQKLNAAGLSNYTQRVTLNGKQVTRVRLGPFSTRKELEKTAARVRALGLPVSMYQL